MGIFAVIQRKQSAASSNPLLRSKAVRFINKYVLIPGKQNLLKFSSYTAHMITNKLLID